MSPAVQDLLAPESADQAGHLLAEDVIFRSPVRNYTGRPDVAHLLTTIGRCLSGISARREFIDKNRSVVEFTAYVGERGMDGVLAQLVDSDGLVCEATLLLRPLSALQEAIANMAEMLTVDPLPSKRRF